MSQTGRNPKSTIKANRSQSDLQMQSEGSEGACIPQARPWLRIEETHLVLCRAAFVGLLEPPLKQDEFFPFPKELQNQQVGPSATAVVSRPAPSPWESLVPGTNALGLSKVVSSLGICHQPASTVARGDLQKCLYGWTHIS